MDFSNSDINKIRLITTSAQVESLVCLLINLDRENLIQAINSILPEDRNTYMYQYMVHTLEFFDKIEKILMGEKEKENEEQLLLDLDEK